MPVHVGKIYKVLWDKKMNYSVCSLKKYSKWINVGQW